MVLFKMARKYMGKGSSASAREAREKRERRERLEQENRFRNKDNPGHPIPLNYKEEGEEKEGSELSEKSWVDRRSTK